VIIQLTIDIITITHDIANIEQLFSISGCCDRVPPSDCCNKVSVEYTEKNEAFDWHPHIYTSYVIEKGNINGRNHYASDDGNIALVYASCGVWFLQHNQQRYEAVS